MPDWRAAADRLIYVNNQGTSRRWPLKNEPSDERAPLRFDADGRGGGRYRDALRYPR
jgi:hypothetical protein